MGQLQQQQALTQQAAAAAAAATLQQQVWTLKLTYRAIISIKLHFLPTPILACQPAKKFSFNKTTAR